MINFEPSNLTLDEDTHQYTLVDDPSLKLRSVTQVVKFFSRPFNAEQEAARYAIKHKRKKSDVLREWKDKSATASELGTAVHKSAEQIARDFTRSGFTEHRPTQGTRAAGYVESVLRFYREHPEAGIAGPVPELRVCHPKFGIAGTIDLVTSLDGVPAIIDFKTSASIDWFGFGNKMMYAPLNHLSDSDGWHYLLQLSFYQFILKEVHGFEIGCLAIVHLLPDSKYRLLKVVYAGDNLLAKVLKKYLSKVKKEEKQCQ